MRTLAGFFSGGMFSGGRVFGGDGVEHASRAGHKAQMNAFPLSLAMVAIAAVAACAPPPKPAPAPRPQVQRPEPVQPRPVTPARSDSWIDQPRTPGTWRWAIVEGKSAANYAGGEFTMVCESASNKLALVRRGVTSAPSAQMTIRTTGESRVVSAVRVGGDMPAVVAVLPPRDSLLDAMAFSRGRFAVEVAGLPTLYLPSWTEVSRVIEDCR